MKKFFTRVLPIFVASLFGFVSTSCSEEEIAAILNLITNLTGQNGESYDYQCNGKIQPCIINGEQYMPMGSGTPLSYSGTITVKATQSTATLTVPAVNVDGVTIGQVTISGLTLTAVGESYTSLSVPDQGVSAEGSITVDGKTYEISNLYLEDAKLTSQELAITNLQLFFGEGEEYLINMTNLTGATAAQ